METEFQVLRQWLSRTLKSAAKGQDFPDDIFQNFQRNKFSSKYINETILAPLDQAKPSSEEGKIQGIPSKRNGLFKMIDHHKNKEYYYAILYFFLLRRFYEQEANDIMGHLLKKFTGIHPIAELKQQVARSFNKAMKKVAKIDTQLLEKLKQLKTTFMDEFNVRLGKVLDLNQIVNEIDVTFPFRPEDISIRKEKILGLAEELSFKPVSHQRPPHRPRDATIDALIISMHYYFEGLGYTDYKKNGLIAQTINYCFFPKNPFDRDLVRLRLSDQWKKKIRKTERKA
jgi:hypothetical protein